MSFWHPDNLRSIVGGTFIARPDDPAAWARALQAEGVSTDTRTIQPGQVFVALRGEHFDGRRFLPEASRAGSPLAIIDGDGPPPAAGPAQDSGGQPAPASPVPPGMAVIRVADARAALLRLAAAYRRILDGVRVIAVTGSNGKTTTSRLIHAVLGVAQRGSCPRRSYNNSIGLPLTILSARRGDQYLVAEIGMNARGEISPLAAAARPDVGVITSIGRAHVGRLGSLEEIAREKASLLDELAEAGQAVVTADAPMLADTIRRAPSAVTFGLSEHADLRVTAVRADESGVSFSVNGRWDYRVPLLGGHNALNAAAAVAVGRRAGLDHDQIAAGLASASGPEMRLDRRVIGGVVVINDAYNANPDSMLAALATLGGMPAPRRRVVVLGDMLELGDHAAASHREVAAAARDAAGADLAVFVGPAMQAGATAALPAPWVRDRAEFLPDAGPANAARIASMLRAGDTVLLKGSRRMGLEAVASALEQAAAATTPRPPTRSPATA